MRFVSAYINIFYKNPFTSPPVLPQAAFECFPNLDYCIITVPSNAPTFPLLKKFVRATPRPVTDFPHELYVLHKNSLMTTMSVRVAVRSDMEVVERLAATLIKPEPLLVSFASAVNDDESEYRAFTFLSDDYTVGVAGTCFVKKKRLA